VIEIITCSFYRYFRRNRKGLVPKPGRWIPPSISLHSDGVRSEKYAFHKLSIGFRIKLKYKITNFILAYKSTCLNSFPTTSSVSLWDFFHATRLPNCSTTWLANSHSITFVSSSCLGSGKSMRNFDHHCFEAFTTGVPNYRCASSELNLAFEREVSFRRKISQSYNRVFSQKTLWGLRAIFVKQIEEFTPSVTFFTMIFIVWNKKLFQFLIKYT
jgi:hypothetical protein